jgi:hypothetical protein
MNKTGRTVFLLITGIVLAAYGYDESLGNLFAPSFVSAPAVEVAFQHRFTRGLGEPSYSLLGAATVDVGVSGRAWKGAGVSFDYFIPNDEIDLGGSYSYHVIDRWLAVYGTVHFFNFKDNGSQSHVSNALYAGALTCQPWNKRLWITGNVAYDGFNLLLVPSAGLLYRVTEKFDIVAEYCFKHDPSTYRSNSFSFGVKFNTWRHQFKLLFSNSVGNGGRSFIAGARDNRLRFGFSIQRLFDF